jgi:hypothetical protein
MIIGMHHMNVRVPRYAGLHPESKRIVLGETEIVRIRLIHERKGAGIVLRVFRSWAENDGCCPEAQSMLNVSLRSALDFGGVAMSWTPSNH